ncbi:MAG: hypothetical protein HC941_24150 [Microcoleus sp. SU_5_3]|nr:hypothetical protein [Microcoleus sp. SU_5_3]
MPKLLTACYKSWVFVVQKVKKLGTDEIQNMMNVLKGKKSFLYKDIEQLVARIESQNSDLEREINNWESRVNGSPGIVVQTVS